jgi:hypothetical protein
MSQPDLPGRSSDGLAALALFYDDFNDIHFFVEDEDHENLYEVILRRMFPELRIARVFPLGGKQAVLEHTSEVALHVSSPRVVHLVDKDFDDLLGQIVRRPTLFYLDRYCIENYFVDIDAVVEIVVESIPRLKRTEIRATLDLGNKIPELMESIRPLFQLFFCVQRFGLGIKNCALPVERFCAARRRWVLDTHLLSGYRKEVIEAASRSAHAATLADPLSHPEVAALAALDGHAVVSGKHICALIFHFLKSKYNIGTISFESFLFRLAKNASLDSLDELAAQIREVVVEPAAQ